MRRLWDFAVGFLCLNLLWAIGSLILNSRALPLPWEVYRAFPEIFRDGIWVHAGASLWRMIAGVFLSLLLGLPAGYLMACFPAVDRLLNPLVYVSYPVPKTALLPAAMLLLGLRDGSKILIMVLTMVFQVTITARDGIRNVPPAIYQVGKSAGKSEWFLLRHVTVPAVLPELFTGLKINLGTAMAILLIVEAYGTRAGLGYYILDAWSRMNYNEMYGGIIVIALFGGILFLILDLVNEKFCRWNRL